MATKIRKLVYFSVGVVIFVLLLWGAVFYWMNLRGIGPVLKGTPEDISDIIENNKPGENNTQFPLKLPDGFFIEIFAKDLPGARVMAFDDFGNMWVSQTGEGAVSLLYVDGGKVVQHGQILKNLNNPHGLVFDPEFKTKLYIAEEHRIITLPTYSDPRSAGGFGEASGGPEKLIDLPEGLPAQAGGGHYTRTLGFGRDGRLFVSIGSSCNVCIEKDDRRAKIFSLKSDGTDFKEFARGLRNTVFLAWHPQTGKMWGTDMGRDLLGDNIPPDEINIIEESGNYGWPTCYGKNIHDSQFDKNTYIRNPCMEPFEKPSHIDLQAHSAPLGLAFVPTSGNWPNEYKNDLIVAFHGSWNRSEPTGYKLIRIKLDANGNYEGLEDFITGWLKGGEALGRPVDVKFGPDGALYVSDDKAGVIYRITYRN